MNRLAREVRLFRTMLGTESRNRGRPGPPRALGRGTLPPADPAPGDDAERSQNALEADLRRYQSLFRRAPIGHLILDPTGVVVEANDAALELMGAEAGRVVSRPLCDHLADGADDLELRRHLFDAFSTRQRQVCELKLHRPDGTTRRARAESIADPYQQKCLTALVDCERVSDEPGVILVVEDERLVRLTVRHYLEHAGYEVLEARDLDDALAVCHGRIDRIDLLITDVVLPKTCGQEIAAQLSLFVPDLPVLYVSAHPKQLLVETRRLEPDDALLQKPFSEPELLETVSERLRRSPRSTRR